MHSEGLRTAERAAARKQTLAPARVGSARSDALRGVVRSDGVLELTRRDGGALWEALLLAGKFARAKTRALLVHVPTLRPVGAAAGSEGGCWSVLVAAAEARRPGADWEELKDTSEDARVVLLGGSERRALLELAGVSRAPPLHAAMSSASSSALHGCQGEAAIMGMAHPAAHAPRMRTDARAVLRYAAAIDAAAGATTRAGGSPGALAATLRSLRLAPAVPRAGPRFADVRPEAVERGIRFSRRPVAPSQRIPHSINSRYH